MKKKSRGPMRAPLFSGPPSDRQQHRMAAESMADTVMRTHPKVKKIKNHITDEISRAARRAANRY